MRNCTRCNSDIAIEAKVCWKCGLTFQASERHNDGSIDQIRGVERTIETAVSNNRISFPLGSLLLIVPMAAVLVTILGGLTSLWTIIACCLVPPLIRTTLVTSRRKKLGYSLGVGQKVLYFFGSFATTIACLIVVIVTMLAALFATCSGLVFGMGHKSETDSPMVEFMYAIWPALLCIGPMFGIFILIFVGLLLAEWTRIRWRRDTGMDDDGKLEK